MSSSAPPTPTLTPAWPDPRGALDESLDRDGVMASTGCTEDDLTELAAIFLHEQANITARLDAATQAVDLTDPSSADWPTAAESVRTAAHELTTSFGILGAKCAELYSRETQKRLRRPAGTPQEDMPTAQDTRTAVRGLQAAVIRVAELVARVG